ncbi:MAG: DUF3857 domain-containing protein, partial [Bacteroidota bacterium]
MKKILILIWGIIFLMLSLSSSAQNHEAYVMAPAPSWLESFPLPSFDTLPDQDIPLQIIHQEYQYNHIKGERYFRYFYYFQEKRALSRLEYFYQDFRPDFQQMAIHTVRTYRGKDTLDLLPKLPMSLENTRTQIGPEVYDDESRVTLSFPKMQVGDVLEIAFTIRGKQPDIHNRLQLLLGLQIDKLRGTAYHHIRNYKDRSIHMQSVNLHPEVREFERDDYRGISFQVTVDSAYKKPVMPRVYYTTPQFFIYDLESWAEKVAYDMENYHFEEPPSEAVQQMTASLISDSMGMEE